MERNGKWMESQTTFVSPDLDERASFEAWAKNEGYDLDCRLDTVGNYKDSDAYFGFQCYLAGAALTPPRQMVADSAEPMFEIRDAAGQVLSKNRPAQWVEKSRHGYMWSRHEAAEQMAQQVRAQGIACVVRPVEEMVADSAGGAEPVHLDGRICEHCGEGNAVLTFEDGRFASNCDQCCADCDYFMVERLNQLIAAPAPSASPADPRMEALAAAEKQVEDAAARRKERAARLGLGSASPAALTDEWRDQLAVLIDIYDDAMNNPPESRTYVDGAFKQQMDEARALLAAQPPAAAEAEKRDMEVVPDDERCRCEEPGEILEGYCQECGNKVGKSQFQATLESVARDAERYRFIKASMLILSGGHRKFGWPVSPFGEQCDRYLDAAMSASKEGA